ncbi:response regulator transcription factor [Paenibacillus sp. 1P07SE]|uniref:response regulator transcription factor n=1 Tax=Paenibacillus sp. 1P07SE TaxID=3132209 RepID=UPI0039A5BDE1
MLRLLVVDDMPIIADGLYELFREEQRMPTQVFKAYSAPEAIRIIKAEPIDVVVTDIKMPEVSGLELLKQINELRPQCKVIFLTSYHDFEFAREAVILGGFDFILKTEGDARIQEAVYKAAEEVLEDRESHELVERAQAQHQLALPMLQQQFLLELLQGRPIAQADRSGQLRALEIKLKPELPVHLVVIRIDRWKFSMNWSDRALLLYSVQNIMDEYLSPRVRLHTLALDSSHIVGLWQPLEPQPSDKEASKTFRFFYGTLETIQNTCRELLKLHISVILGKDAEAWKGIGDKLHRLVLLLQSGIGRNHELLTTDEELMTARDGKAMQEDALTEPGIYLPLMQYASLPALLASGKQEEFMALFEELVVMVNEAGDHIGLKLEALHYLASMFLGYMNRRRLLSEVTERFGRERLSHFDPGSDWSQVVVYFRELAVYLFQHSSFEQEDRSNRLVQNIQQYILSHLKEDLSLTRLGERVHLNPTYLSRLYKQITGEGISDYIMEARMERAKALLEHSELKIHEIAEEVGYQSGIAFTRFFKKMIHFTPQEYRDMQMHRNN